MVVTAVGGYADVVTRWLRAWHTTSEPRGLCDYTFHVQLRDLRTLYDYTSELKSGTNYTLPSPIPKSRLARSLAKKSFSTAVPYPPRKKRFHTE